jgi:tetratricopeptide (TPR) repeat protein
MTGARQVIRTLMKPGAAVDPAKCPSYRLPLWHAHLCWRAGRAGDGLALLNRCEGLRAHAVPLEQERALLLSEIGKGAEARKLVEEFRKGCAVFGDHETLGRLGRTYKNAGDEAWQNQYAPGVAPAALEPDSPAGQQYELALEVYEEAFELTGHYYPGINAASLALLRGEKEKAQRLAEEVARLCAARGTLTRDDPYWVYATEGEAAVVRGLYDKALDFYRNALAQPTADVQMVEAAYHQLCRLWHVRDRQAMARLVDEVFAKYRNWSQVKAGPVGDCGGRK